MLSIVIPEGSSSASVLLNNAIKAYAEIKNIEIICIDKSEAATRAERLNKGFHQSSGSVVLFHHPRSIVEPSGIKTLIEMSESIKSDIFWGGFTHQFDVQHPLLKFTSWYSNNIRSLRKGILYLDHCIFFDRRIWKKDIPAMDIFEDTWLSEEFRRQIRPILLPNLSTTSAIRFQKNGVWAQSLLNQALKFAYYLNIPHKTMNKIYERGLNLNSNYTNEKC